MPYIHPMRKSTRRKVYPLINPITHAIEGACVVDEKKLLQMRKVECDAIEAFRTGRATQQEWHELNEMASLAEVMAIKGVGIEVLAVVKEAEIYLKEAVLRFRKTGKMGFSGRGLTTLIDLQEYHDLQRQSISRGEYWLFIKKMIDLRTGRAAIVQVL